MHLFFYGNFDHTLICKDVNTFVIHHYGGKKSKKQGFQYRYLMTSTSHIMTKIEVNL